VENNLVGHGDAASKGWLTLDVYPGDHTSQAAVWNTAVFPPRAGADRTDVVCEPSASGLTITLQGGAPRDTLLRIWSPKPARVAGLPRTAWRYDAADQRLWVRLAKAHNVKVVVAD
jgi:hypothetical protein